MYVESSLRAEGAYTSECQMPEVGSIVCELLGLLHEGAYTSRCQMPEVDDEKTIYIGDGLYTGDHTKSLGSMDWYREVGVGEGYVSIGVLGL